MCEQKLVKTQDEENIKFLTVYQTAHVAEKKQIIFMKTVLLWPVQLISYKVAITSMSL
jgi:hypothetical protein